MITRAKDVVNQLMVFKDSDLAITGAGLLKTALKDTVLATAASAVKVMILRKKRDWKERMPESEEEKEETTEVK